MKKDTHISEQHVHAPASSSSPHLTCTTRSPVTNQSREDAFIPDLKPENRPTKKQETHIPTKKNETENRKNNPSHEKEKGNTLKHMRGKGGYLNPRTKTGQYTGRSRENAPSRSDSYQKGRVFLPKTPEHTRPSSVPTSA